MHWLFTSERCELAFTNKTVFTKKAAEKQRSKKKERKNAGGFGTACNMGKAVPQRIAKQSHANAIWDVR